MAHELEVLDGRASMFYVGEEPWHGLGTKLDRPATAAEAIKAARPDWTVRKVPLCAMSGNTSVPVPDTFSVVRDDLWGKMSCPVFGIVGKDYTPLQDSEAFSFFDPVVGQNAAIYHTAGVLRDGERIWLLANLPGSSPSQNAYSHRIETGPSRNSVNSYWHSSRWCIPPMRDFQTHQDSSCPP